MGQEGSVSMRCPPHHTHPASITTKLRRFLRKRRSFSKFSPTFFGKSPTFFFFLPRFLRHSHDFISHCPHAFVLLPHPDFLFPFHSMGGLFHARAYTRASSSFALFAFTTFTKPLITSYFTTHYKGIRNIV